jgi:hypothetical protein
MGAAILATTPHTKRWRVNEGGRKQGDGHVAVSARGPLPERPCRSSSGLIFFAKDKELTAKEPTLRTQR